MRPATTRCYFAGVNTRPLAEATRGRHVLVSYAQIKETPSIWTWLRPLLESGHFASAILDSGAFTELSKRKRGIEFRVDLDEYRAFAVENGHLFAWVANLDDIEGDTRTSNRNLEALSSAGVDAVPVYHEGEPESQLRYCVERAREGRGILAIGCQRPKGSLVPRRVVAMLDEVLPKIRELAPELEVHGFGLTRYASDACPCGRPGYALDSVDSTTWIAEACKLHNSGATEDRHRAFAATVDSYQGAAWAKIGREEPPVWSGATFDADAAEAAGGQARTVARRYARAVAREIPLAA